MTTANAVSPGHASEARRMWPVPGQAVGATATFADMGEPGPGRAGHAAYIDAVRRRLRGRDVHVMHVHTGSSGGLRSAELRLRPDVDAFATAVPAEAFLIWDEENGWALGSRSEPATPAVISPAYKGLSVLPDPEDVAAWVVVLLTHPELTPSREGYPFRDHAVEDPAFEAELARYAPDG